jgi:hypothetical protein
MIEFYDTPVCPYVLQYHTRTTGSLLYTVPGSTCMMFNLHLSQYLNTCVYSLSFSEAMLAPHLAAPRLSLASSSGRRPP